MSAYTSAFLIWQIIGLGLLWLAVSSYRMRDKQAGFLANSKPPKVKDIILWNKAIGKLLMGFWAWFALIGLFCLTGNKLIIGLACVLGTVAGVLGMLVVYAVIIEPRHTK